MYGPCNVRETRLAFPDACVVHTWSSSSYPLFARYSRPLGVFLNSSDHDVIPPAGIGAPVCGRSVRLSLARIQLACARKLARRTRPSAGSIILHRFLPRRVRTGSDRTASDIPRTEVCSCGRSVRAPCFPSYFASLRPRSQILDGNATAPALLSFLSATLPSSSRASRSQS